MTESTHFDVQTLIQHREFLRTLAQSIVADEHAAEDVVQQSLVAAMENPPSAATSVKWWLGRIATNFALKSVNREREQGLREREAARPESERGDNAMLDFELFGQVATALRSLPEPYRGTIHKRYFKELRPREIAKVDGVSLETVKTRLKRGLALLREDFDSRMGGRDKWFGAFVALATPKLPRTAPADSVAGGGLTATATVLNGIALMKTLLVSSAVLAAVVVTVFVVNQEEPNTPAADAKVVSASTASNVELEEPRIVQNQTHLANEGSRSPIAPKVDSEVRASNKITGRVGRLRVVDLDAAPLPNVTLSGTFGESAITGADGTVNFAIPEDGGSERIELNAKGYLASVETLNFGGDGDLDFGSFTLIRGGSISGVVTDPSGAGVSQALVVVTGIDEDIWGTTVSLILSKPGKTRPHAYTDAFGHFELQGISPGTVRLWAGAAGLQDAASESIDTEVAGEASGIRIQLKQAARDDEIAGRVVLPDGVSTADLSVWYSYDSFFVGERTFTAPVASNGAFRLQLEESDEHDVWVVENLSNWDARREVWTGEQVLAGYRSTVARDVEPGTQDLVISFEPTRQIEIEVGGKTGELLDAFELMLYTISGEDLAQQRQWSREMTHPASIDVPATNFYVIVSADGYDYDARGPFDAESAPSSMYFELFPVPNKSGRITAEGSPVPGATVELFGLASQEHTIKSHGFAVRTETSITESANANDVGDYRLTVRRSGEYVIRAEAPGWAAAEIGPFNLDASSSLDDLNLELTRGGAIEGRVLLPLGEDPTGWTIGASRGDIYGQTVTVGSDGRYRFDTLTPGPWWVGRLTGHHETSSKRSSREKVIWTGNCEVKLGKTTKFNLDLRETSQTHIVGSWRADGIDLDSWTVRLRPGELENIDRVNDIDRATIDAEGNFALVAPESGDYLLLIEHKNFPEEGVMAIRPLFVEGAQMHWSESLHLGSMTARFDLENSERPVDMPKKPRLAFIVSEHGGVSVTALMPRENGLFSSATAPTGAGSIHYMTPATESLPPINWPVAASAIVQMGEATHVE